MFMNKVVILLVLILVCKTFQNDQNVPYLIPINICTIRYIKLNNLGSGTFSAPPLVLLDLTELSKYTCYINIRTRRYALGIPIIFWNSTYIDHLNSQRLIVDNSGKIIVKVIPPSNILKFQINWRRSDIIENEILLDSSWYNYELNYILPASQIFIMEFDTGNSSQSLCNQMKTDLINTPIQRQELEIKFKNRGIGEKKIPQITITSSDICFVDIISSACNQKNRYPYHYSYSYIYLESAKKVSYIVATNIMKRSELDIIELQEKIRKMVFNYFCETQISYSQIKENIIGTAKVINSRTKICFIPDGVKYNNGTVGVINSVTIPGSNEEFSIPILN